MAALTTAQLADSTDWLDTVLPELAPLESAIRCQVCKDFLLTPMITSCSHTFCSLCIRKCLSNDGRCPACRATEQESKLRNNGALDEIVESFKGVREKLLALATKPKQEEAVNLAQNGSDERQPTPKRKHTELDEGSKEALDDRDSKVRRTTRSQTNGHRFGVSTRSQTASQQPSQGAHQESGPITVVDDSEDDDYIENEITSPSPQKPTPKGYFPPSVLSPPASAPTPPQAKDPAIPSGHGLCPICNYPRSLASMFDHVGMCDGSAPPPSSTLPTRPSSNQAHPLESPRKPAPARPPSNETATHVSRLPNLSYNLLSDKDLRKRIGELGISTQGPRALLIRRHTEWVNLWNANCDVSKMGRMPRSKQKLLADLETWERTQGGRAPTSTGVDGWAVRNGGDTGGGPNGVKAKDFDRADWGAKHEDDFRELARRARGGVKAKQAEKLEQENTVPVGVVGDVAGVSAGSTEIQS